jgi:hypothetical protein
MPTLLHYTNQRVVFIASSILYVSKLFWYAKNGNLTSFIGVLSCWLRINYFLREVSIYSNILRNLMVIFGIIFRVLQGSSNAALYTTSYSIFSSHYDAGDFMKVNSVFKGTIGKHRSPHIFWTWRVTNPLYRNRTTTRSTFRNTFIRYWRVLLAFPRVQWNYATCCAIHRTTHTSQTSQKQWRFWAEW